MSRNERVTVCNIVMCALMWAGSSQTTDMQRYGYTIYNVILLSVASTLFLGVALIALIWGAED